MKVGMINRIKELYKNNGNIMKYLRESENRNYNSSEDMMISYDFQAGTYNKHYMDNQELYHMYHNEISRYINSYISKLPVKKYKILEAGVGEGTTFGPVMGKLDVQPECSYGFDISWSRVKECNEFLERLRFFGKKFIFLGDIFSMPFRDKSRFGGLIVHGIFVAGIFSELIGMRLPGKGSIYLEQNLRFLKPVYVGEPVVIRVRIAAIDERKGVLTLDTEAYGEEGKKLVCGTAKVLYGKPAF